MTVTVVVVDEAGALGPAAPVRALLEATLLAEGLDGAVAVTAVDERTMRDLNRRYRHLDEPTDVLTFTYTDTSAEWLGPSAEPGREGAESGEADVVPDAGEIIVCPEVIARYAAEESRDPGRQLAWTLVHGALHLAGYDHETDEGEMRRREEFLLGRLDRLVTALSAEPSA